MPEDHCKLWSDKEGWGCKHLDSINRYVDEHDYYYYGSEVKYWYQFGKFTSGKIWVIDKDRIKSVLENEAQKKHLQICPIFTQAKVNKTVSSLPSEIDIEKSDKWEVIYEKNIYGEIDENKALSITPKTKKREHQGLTIGISGNIIDDSDECVENNKRYIPSVKFEDIGGIKDIVDTVREVIELPLKQPNLFRYLSLRPHKGILMYGAPGCGKTLIAKAIANEVEAHFISIKGPELLSKWYGQSEENLRNIFSEARALEPTIIYFDEIDAIAQSRSSEDSVRYEAKIVNQLLTLMDGVEEFSKVCVIGSTNRPELIDTALLRPGRFDYILEIKKPTLQGCLEIFKIHTRNMPISKEFNTETFCSRLEGLSGADIAFVVREGAYNCIRRFIDLKELIYCEALSENQFSHLLISGDDMEKALLRIQNARINDSAGE